MNCYHVTSKSLNLKPGDYLLPPVETKVLREHWRSKNLDAVFCTTSMHSIKRYAKKIQDPVVFECKIHPNDWIGFTHIQNEIIARKAQILRVVEM